MNVLRTIAITSALFAATTTSADIISSSPNLLGNGLTVETGLNLGGGVSGMGANGTWTMDHTADVKSFNDINIGVSNCGICPNPNGDGDQEIAVTGNLGSNVMFHTMGSIAGDGHNPAQLQVFHQIGGTYGIGLQEGFTPPAMSNGN